MKKETIPLLLIACIVVVFLVIYFGFPGSTESAPSNTVKIPAGPLVEVVSSTAGYTAWGAPDISGTVKSNTAVPVTAVIAAHIYDESGRRQLANGDSEVSIAPYGQSGFEVVIFRARIIPESWTYRVWVQDVY
jgi:hypothetical protein